MASKRNNNLIVLLGPTASGKTDLSIKLARQFNGEIISADSRQVYKGLDIGSGKVTKSQMRDIPHHLLDVANPKRKFSVAEYQKLALQAIKKIHQRNKVPFLVGGTGFYIQSIVDGIIIPEVKPNWRLRKKLEQKSNKELFLMLKKLDPERAATIDSKNPRRLIRALEIILVTGKPVRTLRLRSGSSENQVDFLMIGIKKSPEELRELINERLLKRIKGIIAEVRKLHASGLSWKRLEELGLEYRYVAQYLQNKPFGAAQSRLTYQEMESRLQKEIEHYARRQMTWFKRDERIHWVKNQREAEKLIRNFL